MKNRIRIATALVLVAATGTATAQALKPEEMIKFRKAGYSVMAWNMGKIKAQTVDAPQTFNKDQVLAAARAIAAGANSGMGALYGAGTDKDAGGEKTRLKSEFFQQPEEARKVGMAFTKEANELARVAESGDINAIKAQFGKVGETCKGCHDKFRKE